MKKYIIPIVIATVIIIIIIALFCWLFLNETILQEKTKIKIEIAGSLSNAVVSPSTVVAEKGWVSIQPKGMILKSPKLGKNTVIFLDDIITFTLSSETEKYWLGSETQPTLLQIDQSVVINFEVKYPDFLTNFMTVKLEKNDFSFEPAEMIIVFSKEKPKIGVKPKQISRLRGIAGTLFPDELIEKKQREFNLRNKAREGLQKLIEPKNSNLNNDLFVKHITERRL